jgi:hypothetical protein
MRMVHAAWPLSHLRLRPASSERRHSPACLPQQDPGPHENGARGYTVGAETFSRTQVAQLMTRPLRKGNNGKLTRTQTRPTTSAKLPRASTWLPAAATYAPRNMLKPRVKRTTDAADSPAPRRANFETDVTSHRPWIPNVSGDIRAMARTRHRNRTGKSRSTHTRPGAVSDCTQGRGSRSQHAMPRSMLRATECERG